jgi:hypothetical protein
MHARFARPPPSPFPEYAMPRRVVARMCPSSQAGSVRLGAEGCTMASRRCHGRARLSVVGACATPYGCGWRWWDGIDHHNHWLRFTYTFIFSRPPIISRRTQTHLHGPAALAEDIDVAHRRGAGLAAQVPIHTPPSPSHPTTCVSLATQHRHRHSRGNSQPTRGSQSADQR